MALALMACVWGYNWVVMKKVLAYAGPVEFTTLRSVLGAVALITLLLVRRTNMRIPRKSWHRVALLGLLQSCMFALLVQMALQYGNAGKSSILAYTMPFWVIPMAWFAFGERIKGLQWVALIMAFGGLMFILQPWQAKNNGIAGEALALGAGLCWAMAAIVTKWIKRDFNIPALPLTAWQLVFGALVLVIVNAFIPEKPIQPTPYFWTALVYNAIFATGLAWFLWLFALQHLPAGIAGMGSLGVPVVSFIAGWLELGERPTGLESAGMLLIASALIVISLQSLRKK